MLSNRTFSRGAPQTARGCAARTCMEGSREPSYSPPISAVRDSMLDLVLYNGRVLTQAAPPLAAAVGIRNGRIEAVGRAEDVLTGAGRSTRRIDLAGRTLVPGLNDAHAHIWKIGHLLTTMLDLRGVEGIDDLTGRVRGFGRRLPEGAWLLGRGYNEAAMIERRPPTLVDLDRAAPDRPVVLTRTCGHIYAVNSRALAAAGIGPETASPVGGIVERDAAGQLTGLLHETAMGLVTRVIPPPSAGDYEAMIVAGLRHQLSLGITSSSDCGVSPALLDVYR